MYSREDDGTIVVNSIAKNEAGTPIPRTYREANSFITGKGMDFSQEEMKYIDQILYVGSRVVAGNVIGNFVDKEYGRTEITLLPTRPKPVSKSQRRSAPLTGIWKGPIYRNQAPSSSFVHASWNTSSFGPTSPGSVFGTGDWDPSSVEWEPNWGMTQLTGWQANTEYGNVDDYTNSPAAAALRASGYQPYNSSSLLSNALSAAMPRRRAPSFLRSFTPPNSFAMMARGGRSLPDAAVIVGERGPEIFVPDRPGAGYCQ